MPHRSWSPSRWSLTRKLPLLTAATVMLVAVTSLTATYRALVQARSEALHERLGRVARQLAASTEQSYRARASSLLAIAGDSTVVAAVHAGRPVPTSDTSAPLARALAHVRQPGDSQMAVELWTADGRQIAGLGTDLPADPLRRVRPELRPRGPDAARAATPLPTGGDSVQVGALYQVRGQVLFWTLIPVLEGKTPIGYVAQLRRLRPPPQSVATVRALIGSDVAVYLRNASDGFWSSLSGEPAQPPVRRDTGSGGFTARRLTGRQIGAESRIAGTPWVLTLESPAETMLAEPRATVRRLAVFTLLIALGGVLVSWIVSRRITRPLVDLATAARALAEGDYDRRVRRSREDGDEIHRLGATFNRMANEVKTAQRALAGQVKEAQIASREQQRASLEAEEARDAAEQANKAKSDFLAVMSHELRTPLNAIGGYTEILEMEIYGPVTPKQREAIARIARSQQTLLSLINDVLNFAKLEAGEVQFAMQDVSLPAVIEALEALIAPQIAKRQLTYRVEQCNGDLIVRADPEKLQQVLVNLLSNAIKFTPVGGEIAVACMSRDNRALIEVRDSGIGIAAERLEAIFDPFIQVGRALNRPHEGVGLGLSISRDLAAGMGGTLSVRSTLGAGSTFTLELAMSELPARV